jgi:hypothetical protein
MKTYFTFCALVCHAAGGELGELRIYAQDEAFENDFSSGDLSSLCGGQPRQHFYNVLSFVQSITSRVPTRMILMHE